MGASRAAISYEHACGARRAFDLLFVGTASSRKPAPTALDAEDLTAAVESVRVAAASVQLSPAARRRSSSLSDESQSWVARLRTMEDAMQRGAEAAAAVEPLPPSPSPPPPQSSSDNGATNADSVAAEADPDVLRALIEGNDDERDGLTEQDRELMAMLADSVDTCETAVEADMATILGAADGVADAADPASGDGVEKADAEEEDDGRERAGCVPAAWPRARPPRRRADRLTRPDSPTAHALQDGCV